MRRGGPTIAIEEAALDTEGISPRDPTQAPTTHGVVAVPSLNAANGAPSLSRGQGARPSDAAPWDRSIAPHTPPIRLYATYAKARRSRPFATGAPLRLIGGSFIRAPPPSKVPVSLAQGTRPHSLRTARPETGRPTSRFGGRQAFEVPLEAVFSDAEVQII